MFYGEAGILVAFGVYVFLCPYKGLIKLNII